jgi:transposase-like protein
MSTRDIVSAFQEMYGAEVSGTWSHGSPRRQASGVRRQASGRNSVRYVSWKDRKAVCRDLRQIYRSASAEQAEAQLGAFEAAWGERYPTIAPIWRRHWAQVIPLFDYPPEIRKVTYTTNAIESLNSVIRKATKNRRVFPRSGRAIPRDTQG